MVPDWEELELDDRLIGVLKAADLNKPAKVQQLSIPQALDGRDLLVSAPTGTGKTLAFGLPLLDALMKNAGLFIARAAAFAGFSS